MKNLNKFFKIFFYSPFFLIEVLLFKLFNKKNSDSSYRFMIIFFSLFGSSLNKFLIKFLSEKKNNRISELKHYINLHKHSHKISNIINENGYFLKKNVLSNFQVSKITGYLKKQKGFYTSDKFINCSKKEYFNKKKPKAVKFFYDQKDLIKFKPIQYLALDKNILSIAQDYLGTLPILENINAWWSVTSLNPDEKAAQFWHFDMDRPSWLKVFIYLTDCNLENGPHCFISGTHYKKEGIPKKLRRKGYSRLSDKEIKKFLKKELIKKFTTKRGSILFEDTSGLHKGLHLKKGSRLILQFQYSSSLFGGSIYKLNIPKKLNDNFLRIKKSHSNLLKAFNI